MKKILFFLLALISIPVNSWAHVKWFSEFEFSDAPATLSSVLTPTFWALMALSCVVISLLTFVDNKLSQNSSIQGLTHWLDQYKVHSLTIMRAAGAAVLLLSFQSNSLFVPELKVADGYIGWVSFLGAVLLLFPRAMFITGLIMIGLYLYGIVNFGWFHMLDYVLFPGVGYYFLVSYSSNNKIKETGLISLYSTVGFSLCWVAMEKVLYPQWSLYILEQNPQLALGLNFEFFLLAAAFIEFCLGYLMIICLLQRPLAIVITLVFFSTTLVFGKLEVIGHTLIHAALIVFILEGAGSAYKPPISLHSRMRLRIPFSVVNFAILLFALLFIYQNTAMAKYEMFREKLTTEMGVDVTHHVNKPTLDVEIIPDPHTGWNLYLKTTNFTFQPERSGLEHVDGQGHAHLYINGKKVNRVYSPWYYISSLPLGENKIAVTLNTNDHKAYVVNDKPIEKSVTLQVKDVFDHSAHK